MILFRRTYKVFSIILLIISTYSQPVLSSNEKIKACLDIASNNKRLACYDRIFKPPVKIQYSKQKFKNSSLPIIETIEKIEKKREEIDTWITYKNKDHVVITKASSLNKGIIIIECKKDITSVSFLLKDAIDRGSAKIIFKSNGEKIYNSTWRIIDNERLIIAPKGIPSVRLVEQISSHNYIDIDISKAAPKKTDGIEYSLRFNLINMETFLNPIKTSCHW